MWTCASATEKCCRSYEWPRKSSEGPERSAGFRAQNGCAAKNFLICRRNQILVEPLHRALDHIARMRRVREMMPFVREDHQRGRRDFLDESNRRHFCI